MRLFYRILKFLLVCYSILIYNGIFFERETSDELTEVFPQQQIALLQRKKEEDPSLPVLYYFLLTVPFQAKRLETLKAIKSTAC